MFCIPNNISFNQFASVLVSSHFYYSLISFHQNNIRIIILLSHQFASIQSLCLIFYVHLWWFRYYWRVTWLSFTLVLFLQGFPYANWGSWRYTHFFVMTQQKIKHWTKLMWLYTRESNCYYTLLFILSKNQEVDSCQLLKINLDMKYGYDIIIVLKKSSIHQMHSSTFYLRLSYFFSHVVTTPFNSPI